MALNARDAAKNASEESASEEIMRLRHRIEQLEREVAEVRHQAHHDPLTSLPNRTLLLDRLRQAILQAARRQRAVGLLLLDLDGFKRINDEFGHRAGDALLQSVAARITKCLRAVDTACRYGGDEFLVLLPEIGGAKDAKAVTEKVRASLAFPHGVEGRMVGLGVSIGTAVLKEGGGSVEDLIAAADRAMYQGKARAASASTASPRPMDRGEDCIELTRKPSDPSPIETYVSG
jgi:diguanylate cyclase (GGDEF)-like protein